MVAVMNQIAAKVHDMMRETAEPFHHSTMEMADAPHAKVQAPPYMKRPIPAVRK